jgi:DNA-binding transcriptional ArsR family regulator
MQMQPDPLSTVFGALADPTRRAILARLAEGGDLTVGELAKPFAMSQPAISRHLKVLEGAGLISRRRRQTAHLSHLEGQNLRDATAWLVRYQDYWDESNARLDALLARLQADPTAPRPSAEVAGPAERAEPTEPTEPAT